MKRYIQNSILFSKRQNSLKDQNLNFKFHKHKIRFLNGFYYNRELNKWIFEQVKREKKRKPNRSPLIDPPSLLDTPIKKKKERKKKKKRKEGMKAFLRDFRYEE